MAFKSWLSGLSNLIIVAAWVFSMVSIYRENYPGKGEQVSDRGPVSLALSGDFEDWFGIYSAGSKIGYSMQKVHRIEGGILLSESSLLRLPLAGALREVFTNSFSVLGNDLSLRSFNFSLTSGDYEINVNGHYDGRGIVVHIVTDKNNSRIYFPTKGKPYTISAIPFLLSSDGFKKESYKFLIFDSSAISRVYVGVQVLEKERVKVNGETLLLNKIKISFKDFSSTMWIDNDGRVFKEESLMNMVMVKEPRSKALSMPELKSSRGDLLSEFAVPSNVEIEDPRRVRYLRVKLSGVRAETLDLEDFNQRIVSRDPLILEISSGEFSESSVEPDTSLLGSDPFIQSRDLRIKRKAVEIAGGEEDSFAISLRLSHWVYSNIEKGISITIPSAIEVLSASKGACNEHTTLYVALARSLGIPAKFNIGLVYLRGKFYYHAWPSVYVHKRSGESGWIALDPTFGQTAVDATHIKLLEGGFDKQIELLRVIGNLNLEILDYM